MSLVSLRRNPGFVFVGALALVTSACSNPVAVAPRHLGVGGDWPSSGNGTSGTSSSGSTSSSGAGGAGSNGAEPPPPGATMPGDGGGLALGVKKLYLGSTDRNGTPDANGWMHYGFDIDHKTSTASSTDLCKPAAMAASSDVYPDGDEGIDNAWGQHILPIYLGLSSDYEAKVNGMIASGDFTLVVHLDGLGGGNDYNPLVSKLYGAAALGAAPKWDGYDAWPVRPEDLTNPTDIESAKATFPQSYITGGTWVAGGPTASIRLPMLGDLVIQHAVLAMKLAPNHFGATMGTISGVIDTEAFIASFKKAAAAFDPSLCSGPTFDAIANQLRQASDILSDGTQDPNKTCDGISIGLGFDAAVIQPGGIAPPAMPSPDPCAAP